MIWFKAHLTSVDRPRLATRPYLSYRTLEQNRAGGGSLMSVGMDEETAQKLFYAVFEDGSRQYRVAEGDVVRLDYRDAEVGSEIEFKRVLLYCNDADTQIGKPVIEGARIIGEVIEHPTIKLYVQHFRRRKNYRRLRGHRQPYTSVLIRHILLAGREPPPPESESAEE
jgi:large subunit ribosomal protein L21